MVVVVDTIDDKARRFYKRNEFIPLKEHVEDDDPAEDCPNLPKWYIDLRTVGEAEKAIRETRNDK